MKKINLRGGIGNYIITTKIKKKKVKETQKKDENDEQTIREATAMKDHSAMVPAKRHRKE